MVPHSGERRSADQCGERSPDDCCHPLGRVAQPVAGCTPIVVNALKWIGLGLACMAWRPSRPDRHLRAPFTTVRDPLFLVHPYLPHDPARLSPHGDLPDGVTAVACAVGCVQPMDVLLPLTRSACRTGLMDLFGPHRGHRSSDDDREVARKHRTLRRFDQRRSGVSARRQRPACR